MDSTAYMGKLTDDLLVAIISYLPLKYAARGLILLQFPYYILLRVSNPLTRAYHLFPYGTDFVTHSGLETDTRTGFAVL